MQTELFPGLDKVMRKMDRIHVSVRARPLSPEDIKTSPWRISENSIFIPSQQSKFEFDRIFGEESKTEDVYKAQTKDIVAAAVKGFNGTVFAYGQTSSGKTHTMRGSSSEPGVIPLSVHELFHIIQQDMDREFLLRMSYMEIYNEEINDLLAPEHRKLQIHESIERGIFVAGLREEIVASAEHVLELMEFGESHRHIGETNMNVYSSRSHTIFRMIIESREISDDVEADISCDAVRVSVLNLVDLAGSERAAKTGAEGVRLKEGSHINKSLMTLGTVIKKLSEGAESQGGHVPYRDSKLTRILQPALGGNANTAIICNITLAQIHADETKSSLQFASRALRVTNCAHVNEILTDAALLKRQKKEIEELRAKLQGLHSEHLEEEILNLRNTLLTSELERERMALELEEERKAHAEREKRLQEQAKKIENLSSMFLCANRDETRDVYKVKRRDTWCPGNLARETSQELYSAIKERPSDVKSSVADRTMGSLLPFQELVTETSTATVCKQIKNCGENELENCLPDPHALRHVTSRRKAAPGNRSLPMENQDLAEIRQEYENLLLKFETHKTISDAHIDYLTRKLAEADLILDAEDKSINGLEVNTTSLRDGNRNLWDTDAILVIKKLQEKIAMLEMENSSSQQNLDCSAELAAEQTISAQNNYKKLYEELLLAREEETLVHQAPTSSQSNREESGWLVNLLTEAQETMKLQNSEHFVDSISLVLDDFRRCFSFVSNLILDLKPSASQILLEMKSIVNSHEKIHSCLRNKIIDLENEKRVLCCQGSELQSKIQELSLQIQNSANSLMELSENHEMEKSDFLVIIQNLQKEISSLSSFSLAKEKENIRKDLEKTKLKLKEVEFKLKNAVQEKTKLEGEKACAEREVKRLHGQKALLERDMSKRDTIFGRRHETTTERNSNVFDQKRAKDTASVELEMQEEYNKLEVLAFEMDATIESLEDQLATAHEEKDVITSRSESLALELQELSDELDLTRSELCLLKEEVSVLKTSLEESRAYGQELDSSLNSMLEEKDELSMQLTEALLTMEEEKAIWMSKEKASVEVLEEKTKLYTAEISMLSEELLQVRNELGNCTKYSKDIEERLRRLEEEASSVKCRETSSVVDLTANEPRASDDESEKYVEEGMILKLEHELMEQNNKLASLAAQIHKDQITNNKEKAKSRMRLRGTQAKLDSFRIKYEHGVEEMEHMDKRYREASEKLKKQLGVYGTEVLNLKKQLSTLQGRS
ncbi:kinesin-like protein KIN-7O isoform X2 [Primulina huaijiensis]|uniref:kinesin-like protein KIN-7O isoform X2 n=1 Tax=Primulina huaijiensis TaxID=1492673 RepID=UPI003CC75EFE